MCGFAGLLTVKGAQVSGLEAVVTRMAAAIQHRGPDDSGAWSDVKAGIALGHRRLSVIDLSPAGHQPMVSATGRYVIAFNGEIYNHADLRTALERADAAPVWRGHSDTETLLAAFDYWGVEATLRETVGMFAFALWNVRERTLQLARDRFGEKPLYYGWVGHGAQKAFVFASELKALRVYPGFDNPVCREALAEYMRFTCVPAPRSIYHGLYKLEPGCLLTAQVVAPVAPPSAPIRPGANYGSLSVRRWWSLAEAVEAGARDPISHEGEALEALEWRLKEAVKLQSLADVPLGAFLSGGVDSSTIVSLMQEQATRKVKTFTVGFEEAEFDESPFARAVAQHLGTDHSELFVSAAEAQGVIPLLPTMYDEPFADSSQIPTHLVSRSAREKVVVALSGDAGDELFGGYNRYARGWRIWKRLAWLPYPARHAIGAALQRISVDGWDSMGRKVNAMLPISQRTAIGGQKVHKLAGLLSTLRNMDDYHTTLVSIWQDPGEVVKGHLGDRCIAVPGTGIPLDDSLPLACATNGQLLMMYRDSMVYLPDDILCKVDRAAMAISLETRVPFLDHRVVELAWRLPITMKIRAKESKWALRQLLYKFVPRELIDRPKAGFSLPIGQWLRGPLRPWAEGLLDEQRLNLEGYFFSEPIRRKWNEHLRGSHDHTARLWAVLMFQSWLESVK